MKKILLILTAIAILSPAKAQPTSVAGLYPLENSGRVVYNFNEGWRFCLGDAKGAEAVAYDDSWWPVVSAPHAVQLEPSEASGGRNYQGACWYRKTFTVPSDMAGKDIIVHFEAIMGKQQVYVNGRKVKENEGGYLPITISLTAEGVKAGDKCLVAVRADNSDDSSYPPGKKQSQLDFAYHGGMYRDVWLIGKSKVAITDAIEENKVAGGGIFVHYDNITARSATVYIDTELRNNDTKPHTVTVEHTLKAPSISPKGGGNANRPLREERKGLLLQPGEAKTISQRIVVKNPQLWSPETPCLYQLETRIKDGRQTVDGGITRLGIRLCEFRGKDGFWLNGQPYHQLIGGNRHQDFAYVGNALPNSQQWRDALRLKQAGMTIVRAAHYPQDPAFMDACDELGLFIIVPTPGWQFWNKAPEWAEKVHQNTRSIIRRDRNHPCVLMWEPILNETRYPKEFALKALLVTREEYPWPGRPVAAADLNSEGVKDNYDVIYDWADNVGKGKYDDLDKCIFTREWGEYVDDWYAHNAINRAARGWGEHAQLAAALSLADTYGMMYRGQRQFIGGCLWHPFDHQRGYHPDAYLGGIYDAFRQPKLALEMFKAQIPSEAEGGAFLCIAHELTQFSPSDVTVFTNCDSVRLTALNGWKTATLPVLHRDDGTPSAPVTFTGFWDFWKAREQSYTKRSWQTVKLVAEGIVGGKVVCREEKMPSRRSTKLRLYADDMGRPLVADGSDFIVVVAEVTDDSGHVRRLAREHIQFTVEGEGSIIGDETIMANPRQTEWGTAPVLIRSTHRPGAIRIIARPLFDGIHAPMADTLTIESTPATMPQCYSESGGITNEGGRRNVSAQEAISTHQAPSTPNQEAPSRRKLLEEVERQQQDFGIK